MKKLVICAIFVLALLFSIGTVSAVVNNGTATSVRTGQYTGSPGTSSIAAEGGNVTAVNITTTSTTSKWQGFYGNITTSLRLGDGNNLFYNWTGTVTGSLIAVFVSPGNSITFGALNPVDSADEKAGIDGNWSFTSSDDDSGTNTFSSSATCTAGTEIVNSYGVTSLNTTGNSIWETCVAIEASVASVDDFVFGTNITSDTAFDGVSADYQLMVPVLAANDNYYFYLEV